MIVNDLKKAVKAADNMWIQPAVEKIWRWMDESYLHQQTNLFV